MKIKGRRYCSGLKNRYTLASNYGIRPFLPFFRYVKRQTVSKDSKLFQFEHRIGDKCHSCNISYKETARIRFGFNPAG